ncbi:hypothetical protein AB0D34_12145 [Streptomyces sp. NPDC048420]|uniref:hypothetical protein n=1 Tax=Streptomyces sp. NPDC048420 TaxID=3155755 RepID=UPI00342E8673
MNPRRIMRCAAGAVAVAAAVRHTAGLCAMRRTLATVDQPAPPEEEMVAGIVHFVVPVLREQPHIRAAVDWFVPLLKQWPGSTLTLVTTARERAERILIAEQIAARSVRQPHAMAAGMFPELADDELRAVRCRLQRPGPVSAQEVAGALDSVATTDQVVDAVLADPALAALPIRHVHYTGTGRKAAQVNQAAAGLPRTPEPAYLAVYDIDSRPGPELIERTWASIVEYAARQGSLPGVVQQSARFTSSGASPHRWERALCLGAARLQTLWTLRREIPAFRRYTRAVLGGHGPVRMLAGGGALAQTVGHGLWVRLDVFGELDGLPTYTVLDDLPFGFRATVEHVPVHVVDHTATAPGPEDARTLLEQGRRWFANYLDYSACWAESTRCGRGTPARRATALAAGWYRGATWLARTPATVTCLYLLLRPSTRLPMRATAATALWLGLVTPIGQLAAAEGRLLSPCERAQASFELLLAYLVSSAGPALAFVHPPARPGAERAMAPKTNRRLTSGGTPSAPSREAR